MGEPDRAGDLTFVLPRRSSTALNDDLVDIGDFQQFSTNRVEAVSSKCARRQTCDVDALQVQNAPDDRGACHKGYCSNRRVMTTSRTA